MNTKILKKLLSAVTAVAMASQLAFVIPASATEEEVYSGTPAWTVVNGSTATGTNVLVEDPTKSVTVSQHIQGGGSGDRYAYTYPVDVSPTDAQSLKVEFYLNVAGSNSKDSHIYIVGTESKKAAPTSGIILDLKYSSWLGTYTANDVNILDNINIIGEKDANQSTYRPTPEAKYNTTGLIKYEAEIDFATKMIALTVHGKEAKTYNFGFVDTSVTKMIGFASLQGRALAGAAIADVKVILADKEEIKTYYTVTYDVGGVQTSEVVESESTVNVEYFPDTEKTGYIFQGWAKDGDSTNLLTTEAVQALKITADTTFTAVYEADPDYIEPMASVEFSTFPSGGMLAAGADADTAASNNIAVKVTGELGTDLLANPDSRVNDLDVKYELKGFRWIASENRATSDIAVDEYCDSYGKLVIDGNRADFQIKSHPFNYYGEVVATVTYNGQTMTVSKPLVYLGDTTADANTILPRGGYISNFNNYSSDMVGYETTISSDNRSATDVVTDNWAAYGGNSKVLKIAEENGEKFMKLNALGTNSSCFAANQISSVTDAQVMFSQKVRFYQSSTILLKSVNPVTWTTGEATTFSVNFTGSELNINGSRIADAATGEWYEIVISSDVTSKKCFAAAYDSQGNKLGESEIVDFSDAGSVTPKYYMFRTPDKAKGELDFNDVKIYRAIIDQNTIVTTKSTETVAIPEDDTVSEATLTIDAKTTEGYASIGAATWTTDASGVTVTPAADDTHTATLAVSKEASAGDLTVNVTLGGITRQIELALTSSQDSIKFENPQTSVSIPLDSTDNVVNYSAMVIDKDGNPIEGKDVTLELYDKNNANPVTVDGVTFENGVMTITKDAKAATVYIRATSTNSNNEPISNAVKVVIHGLAFDLGAGTDEDIADGYTAVTPTTGYTEKLGYGIEGNAEALGEASLTDASTDYLSGTFTFKANVEKNKIYKVTLDYLGTAAFENVSTDLSGVVRTNAAKGKAEYLTFVNDDVLDISFSDYIERDDNGNITVQETAIVSSIEIEKVEDKTAGAKPNIYTVGDSTNANNGSWAYVLARDIANYPELTALASFTNNGRGGKNLSTYYTGGEFWDRVVTNIKPGDYVMIGDMGTNGMGSDFEGSFNYYIDTCITMGAKVILNSYTPHGAVGDYAGGYSNGVFDSYRKDTYDNIVREIYAERKSELVGFVEIGKNADAAFNAYITDYEANGYSSVDEAAQAIIFCFGDHNHYSNGSLACSLMLDGYGDVDGIVAQLVDILSGANTEETGVVIDTAAKTVTFKGMDGESAVVYVAEYNSDGTLDKCVPVSVTVSGAEYVENITYTDGADVKVFVWQGMKPVDEIK